MRLATEKKHKKYWEDRKIDWNQAYMSTWDHPHRQMLVDILKKLKWGSLFEVGCACGPNLVKIVKEIPNVQVGGTDVSSDAIDLAKKTFQSAYLTVGSADDILMSDDSTDIVLTDMTLIYVSQIDKAIKEIKRVARNYVLLCELHSPSWLIE